MRKIEANGEDISKHGIVSIRRKPISKLGKRGTT
jgi:hypothetical protein